MELKFGTPYYVNGDVAARIADPGNWNAHYDPVNGVLTLKNLNVVNSTAFIEDAVFGACRYGILAGGDPSRDTLTIVLEGTNSVSTAAAANRSNYAVRINCKLTIQGTGTLTATAGNGSGTRISSHGLAAASITQTGGTVTGKGGEANDSSYGVMAEYITVSGGSITGTGGKATAVSSYGVHAGGTITASGGSITGTGGEAKTDSCGVFTARGEMTAESGGSITGKGGEATENNSYGVYVGTDSVDITVNGGSIKGTGGIANNYSYGVRAMTDITASGGSIEGTGTGGPDNNDSFGVYAENNITTESGSITGTGGDGGKYSYGVYTKSGEMQAKGGSITGTGGEANGSGGISRGVSVSKNITADGGSITGTGKTVTGVNSNSAGVYAENITITANGNSIEGTGGTVKGSGISYGVRATAGITANGDSIKGTGGSIEGTVGSSNKSYGLYADDSITTESGSITGTGGGGGNCNYSYGVYTQRGEMKANGGSITGTGGTAGTASNGVFAVKKIEITNGSLTGVGDVVTSGTDSLGIDVADGDGAINLNTGAIVLAKGKGKALSKAPTLATGVIALGSTSYEGSGVVTYDSGNNNDYKYFRTLATIPALQLSVSPQPIFPYGQAPENEKVTIKSTLPGFDARNYFGSATMDGAPLRLGTVGSPGADGSVSNGSIVIHLNKAYLDTLSVGTHTLLVNLAGVYTGNSVEAQITVLPSGDGTGGAGDVPETGDSATPMLWLGIALLASAGLAASAVRRRKRQNG